MIVDTMTKMEVMLSLNKEFKEEVLPYYRTHIKKRLRIEVLPKVIRLGSPLKKSFDYKSSSSNEYHLTCTVTKIGDGLDAYCKFFWKGKICFASFFDDDTIVVYQNHSIERYAERVLREENLNTEDVFKKYILHEQNRAYQIALQAPNRERCRFCALADALFLGDYDEPTLENKGKQLYWYNTCISLKEAHGTQTGILHSLAKMQYYIKEIGYNPLNATPEEKFIAKTNNKSPLKKQQYYIELLKLDYMMIQLQLSMNFPWINLYEDEIKNDVEYITTQLSQYGINTSSLSPFGDKNGFAIRGEINYKG